MSTLNASSLQQTGMAFLGIGAGQVIACATQPYFNKQVHATLRSPRVVLIVGNTDKQPKQTAARLRQKHDLYLVSTVLFSHH